jgi:hypothetical protein
MIFRTTHSRVCICEGVLYICCTLCVQESLPIYIYHITYQRVLSIIFSLLSNVYVCVVGFGFYVVLKNTAYICYEKTTAEMQIASLFFFFFFFLSLLEQLKVDNIVSLEASCYK